MADASGSAAAARLERRRRQCRRSQRRYRDKQGSEEYNLVLDVNELRQRVEHLRVARDVMSSRLWSSRLAPSGAAAKAARQYYVVFAHGLHEPESGGPCVQRGFEVQRDFARAFFDEEVQFGGGTGVDAVLEQWRCYSQFHESLRVEALDAQVVGPPEAPVVVVRGLLVVRLSRRTIVEVFPHVLADEPLVQALIGQRVVYPTQTEYAFNERVQVVRQDLSVDFLEGLNALLHDMLAASQLLQRARITDSSRFFAVGKAGADADACASLSASARVAAEPERMGTAKPQPDRLQLSYIMS